MKASVIILTWNGKEVIRDCLEAVLAQDYADFTVWVVDNGSTDGTPDLVAGQFPQVRLIRNERNLGFAAGNNMGLRAAGGDLLVLLNQDTRVHPGWLTALAAAVKDPSVGIVGCKLLYPDGTIQHAGGYLHGPRGETDHVGRGRRDDGRFDEQTEPEFVTAAALGIRREALARIGLLDEGFAPAYYEDVDWCYRARRAGFRVVYVPQAVVTHYESTTAQPASYRHKLALNHGRVRFLLKHWPLERLLAEFGPAERAWVVSMARSVELMTARRAYLDAILDLNGIAAFRGSAAAETEALLDLLLDLRAAALTSLEALPAAPPPPPPPPAVETEEPSPSPVPESPAPVRPKGGLRAKLRGLWTGLRYLNVLPDLVKHLQQHDRILAQYGQALAQHGQALAQHGDLIGHTSRRVDRQEAILEGQVHDVTENIREITLLAQELQGLAARLERPNAPEERT